MRFKPLDFEVLKTPHFDIHYYPEEQEAARIVGRMAERWYTRLSQLLDHELPPGQPVILYDSHPAFRQTTVLPEEIGVGTGGVTEGLKRRVVLPMAGSLGETDHVLGHELVHAFQYDMTSRSSDSITFRAVRNRASTHPASVSICPDDCGGKATRRLHQCQPFSESGWHSGRGFLSARCLLHRSLFGGRHQRKVIKTLTRTAVDPHLDSLEFIYGSGGWSRDGKYFAFSTLRVGKPRIIILADPWR